MARRRPFVHRTIVVVDVEGFCDRRRTIPHQVTVREGLYKALREAFDAADLSWTDCEREDRGDGLLILAPAEMPKAAFVEALPHTLAKALGEHNATHSMEEQIRLRMALHAGEVAHDDHGVASAAVNLAFRLLEAHPVKAALTESQGVLAVIVSAWFFDEVVRHSHDMDPATFRPARVAVKETSAMGWISLPDHPYPSDPALCGAAGAGETMTISIISGSNGICETLQAVRWAHQNRNRIPGGQVVLLSGFGPCGQSAPLSSAVRGFLDVLGSGPCPAPDPPTCTA